MLMYNFCVGALAFLLDMILGDPHFSLHPIRILGNLVSLSERILRKMFPKDDKTLFIAGVLLVGAVCALWGGSALLAVIICRKAGFFVGMAAEALVCWSFVSARALKGESMKVYKCLKDGDTEAARTAVSMIVGRDTASLDREGIIKAAVETVAENFSDGVAAPLFYIFLGGGVLGALYKAVNTMDSMVGYKNERYIYFGRAAARLDDAVNFIPSRLSAIMLIAAAFILGKDFKNAVRIFMRDRLKHASPNSAQTEAVCAGALGIRLAGDAYYFGKLYKKPYIGDEINRITNENIKAANDMMYAASGILTVFWGMVVLSVFGV